MCILTEPCALMYITNWWLKRRLFLFSFNIWVLVNSWTNLMVGSGCEWQILFWKLEMSFDSMEAGADPQLSGEFSQEVSLDQDWSRMEWESKFRKWESEALRFQISLCGLTWFQKLSLPSEIPKQQFCWKWMFLTASSSLDGKHLYQILAGGERVYDM